MLVGLASTSRNTRLTLEARSCIWVLAGRLLAGLGTNQQEYEDTRLILEARSCIPREMPPSQLSCKRFKYNVSQL